MIGCLPRWKTKSRSAESVATAETAPNGMELWYFGPAWHRLHGGGRGGWLCRPRWRDSPPRGPLIGKYVIPYLFMCDPSGNHHAEVSHCNGRLERSQRAGHTGSIPRLSDQPEAARNRIAQTR